MLPTQNIVRPSALSMQFEADLPWIEEVPSTDFQSLIDEDARNCLGLAHSNDGRESEPAPKLTSFSYRNHSPEWGANQLELLEEGGK
ncbi:MAG: hypothetical protein NTNFB02_25280 [Nitrospira sp.]